MKRGLLAPKRDVADELAVAVDPKLDPNEKDVAMEALVAWLLVVSDAGVEAEANKPPVLPVPNIVDGVLTGAEELPNMEGEEEEFPNRAGAEAPTDEGNEGGVADDVCPNDPNGEVLACC